MSYYHSSVVRGFGGLKGRLMRRVVGDTWEEMLTISRLNPETTVINCPPTGVDSWKSRSLPTLKIDADQEDYLDEICSAEVSEHHILVQTWRIREEIYASRHEVTPEIGRFFANGIRGSLRELLKAGAWIDKPENHGLQNLNKQLEKIDLGRRSDLKFSSNSQGDLLKRFTKYDKDAHRDDLVDPSHEYLHADPAKRIALRKAKPWMATKWIAEFGE